MRLLTSTLFLLTLQVPLAQGTVVISEVADKGSSGVCKGNDWVELHNSGSDAIDMSGWLLYDSNGPSSEDAFTFPDGTLLDADEYRVLCTKLTADDPTFGIGGDDTLTLLDPSQMVVISSVGPLLGGDTNGFDISFALQENEASNVYQYTTTPTPGAPNVITPVVKETAEDIKERLSLQNQLAEEFFNMDPQGLPIANGMAPVLEIHINMTQENLDYMYQNRSYEVYVPFESIQVKNKEGAVIETLNSPGRIRSKGQWTLFISACMGAPSFPMQLDVDHTNASQTLFGVQRFYLRNHGGDYSNLREWSVHRMLARFGLPYLRARHVNAYINNVKVGFYTLMEAPDQEYVFARSFPDYNPLDYALFKVKSMSISDLGCLTYAEEELAGAREQVASVTREAKPSKAYERGDHREIFPVLGDTNQCMMYFFFSWLGQMKEDAVAAFVEDGEPDCGSFYVKEGFVDRDLGTKGWEPIMEDFINDNWFCRAEEQGCTATDRLASQVDTDQILKSLAFYAATIFTDSPLGNGNNYYLAAAGDGLGWKIVPYDLNTAGDGVCNPAEGQCPTRLIYWSILRPTCQSLESNPLVGPLLTDPTLHQQYLDYVQSFVETVMDNSIFMDQVRSHLSEIASDAEDDYWLPPGGFELELSEDPADWEHEQVPWVPFLKARAEQIRLQFDALAEGTFPRGPHLESPNEPDESCPDWRSTEPPPSCFQNCFFEGCFQAEWLVPFFCDLSDSTCYHGEADPQCAGVSDGTKYEGMEDRGDIETSCFDFQGMPVRMSACPKPPGFGNEEESNGEPSTEDESKLNEGLVTENVTLDSLSGTTLSSTAASDPTAVSASHQIQGLWPLLGVLSCALLSFF